MVAKDKWAKEKQRLSEMSNHEHLREISRAKTMCICSRCPSFIGTNEKNMLFCYLAKSNLITDENGCICGTCPIVEHTGLTRLYYCIRGNEETQREVNI